MPTCARRDGPGALVRTLRSHVGYYERWAKTWEFQALLKARAVAGDEALGAAYIDAVLPFVWSAADRDGFVTEVQRMRQRVERNVPAKDADRQLKLGRGGLRDVEFSVQLLQLVHGRSDVMLRSPTTLTALESLATWGYVGREDASALAAPTGSCGPWSTGSRCTGWSAPTWCPGRTRTCAASGARWGSWPIPAGSWWRPGSAVRTRCVGSTRSCSTGRCWMPSRDWTAGRRGSPRRRRASASTRWASATRRGR